MAASGIDIDFEAIGKAFFRTLPKYSDIQDSEMMSPDFRNVELKVIEDHIEWLEDNTNSTGACPIVAEVKADPNYPFAAGETATGRFKTTQKMDEISKIVITKGRIADIGKTVTLPLKKTPEDVCKVLKGELPIDPSRGEDQIGDPMTVTQKLKHDNLPPEGAKKEIVSGGISYKGKFTCRVYPEGKCLLQKVGPRFDGTNPKIQQVINKLKTMGSYQHLVKNFGFDKKQSLYFWMMEGVYELKKAPKLSINKK